MPTPTRRCPVAKKSVAEILAEKMPGMEVVEEAAASPAADRSVRAATPGPSMEELRKKYLGDAEDAADAGPAGGAGDDADVEVKTVRPKGGPADPTGPAGKRTVIVSKKRGVLGSQG
jgi:hypothetical protein